MSVSLSDVRGFNYSGSWGTSGLDLWQHHDNDLMAQEIARGKGYFPKWNTVRWWLSYDAFLRNPERFLANFEAGLVICAAQGLTVMPVLFNRWRELTCDFGVVSIEDFVPGLSVTCEPGSFEKAGAEDLDAGSVEKMMGDYIGAVVGGHRDDERVFAWDLCNEPLDAPYLMDPRSIYLQGEVRWLTWCRDMCRLQGAEQPLTIGNCPNLTTVEVTEPISDFLSIHPYYIPQPPELKNEALSDSLGPVVTKEGFEAYLDDVLEFAAQTGKEVLATETVWGAVEDAARAELVTYTLGELTKRNIGFIAHALHHSLIADLHAAEYGPVGVAERLEFINADGSLREGHEAYNLF